MYHQVKKEAQNCLKRNKEILDLIREIIKGYESINNNYYIEKNITKNTIFNFDFGSGTSIAHKRGDVKKYTFQGLETVVDV